MKITADKSVTKDLDRFIGKSVRLKYRLNNNYEIEVHMPINWNMKTLPTALKDSFIEPPREIHILSIIEDKSMLN